MEIVKAVIGIKAGERPTDGEITTIEGKNMIEKSTDGRSTTESSTIITGEIENTTEIEIEIEIESTSIGNRKERTVE